MTSNEFKVISSAESKEIGEWDIQYTKTGEVVARIVETKYYNGSVKYLKVKDKVVCKVKNQKEAIEQLEKFFFELDRDIKEMRNNHSLLGHNLSVVEGYYTHNLILDELKKVEEKIKKLEEYSLN